LRLASGVDVGGEDGHEIEDVEEGLGVEDGLSRGPCGAWEEGVHEVAVDCVAAAVQGDGYGGRAAAAGVAADVEWNALVGGVVDELGGRWVLWRD